MKKTLLILCALVCGTLAFAQTSRTYTDWMHVVAGNDDAGVQKSDVAVEWTDESNRVIDFVLKDFSVTISMSNSPTEIPLGDVTMLGINVGEADENGVATISCTGDHEVTFTDQTWAAFVNDISVNMTGDISEAKLHADMEIAVSIVLFGNYTVTATFGYDYGEYLIVNAENGNYFGGGLDYGTHATETDKPQFFTFIQESDGTYLINGHQAKSTSLGLDEAQTSYYIDAVNPLTWELVAADDGSGYYIADDDGYLTGNGIYKAATTESQKANATVWKLVTMDEVLATMEGASISNPVDVTPLIPAPEPKYNSYKNSWTATGYNEEVVPKNYCFGGDAGWNATTPLFESFHSENGFDVRQTISSLPVGYYELTAQAFYRNDGGTVIPSMYITTGTCATDTNGKIENVHLPEHNTTSDNMNEAYEEFLKGLYPVTLPFVVDAEGEEFTVGIESNVEADDVMWSIFGELSLFYLGTDLPTLTTVTGKMNVDVEAAMTAAITAYNNSKTSANFIAAEQAILDAEESVAYYAEIAEGLESDEIQAVIAGFDDAGKAAFENDFMAAYTACTLTNETLEEGLAAACKAQTTAGSDMSYALLNSGEWTAAQGNGPNPYSTFATETYIGEGEAAAGKVLYYTVEDLKPGTYTVAFYAAANMANGVAGDTGDYLAEAYANDATPINITIGSNSGAQISSLDNMTYVVLTCTVESDGVLEFGIEDIGAGGNWFLCAAESLTLVEIGDDCDYEEGDVIEMLNFKGTVVGTNLFVNGGFNQAVTEENTIEGWTAGNGYTDPLSTEGEGAPTITYSGGYNDGPYVTLSATGASDKNTPTQAIAVTPGKSYLLVGYTKYSGSDDDLPDSRYSALFSMNDGGTAELSHHEAASSANYSNDLVQLKIENTGEWVQTEGIFTVPTADADSTYKYVGMRMNWSTASYDGLQLYELEGEFTFPEDADYAEGSEVIVDGVTYTVKTGENLIENGSFNERTTGWTYGNAYTNPLGASQVTYSTDGGYNDGPYITSKGGGSSADTTPSQAVEVETGKTYLFVGYTKGKTPTKDNMKYNGLMQMSNATTEAHSDSSNDPIEYVAMNWGADAEAESTEWTQTIGVFTAETDYAGVRFAWCPGASFDGIQLYEVEEVELDYDYDVTWKLANPSFEVDNVVANLTADETRGSYKVMSLTGWDLVAPTHQNSSYPVSDLMTAKSTATDNNFGVPGDPADGTYMLYLRDANVQQNDNHLDDASVMQTITLPAGDYKLTVDSKCVATSTAAGKVTLVADEHSKALTIHVTENGTNDTASNPFLASWDTASLTFSLDTETEVIVGVNIEFTDGSTNYPLSVLLDNFKLYSVEEIEKSISWEMTDAGWGTLILPFAATLEGLTAYSCSGTELSTDEEGEEITVVSLTEVGTSITANTPYVIKCTDDSAIKEHTFAGTPINEKEIYSAGLLTGTLVDLAVGTGAAFTLDGTEYVLQNHETEGVAFYPIIIATDGSEDSSEVTLDAYHCYLTTVEGLSVLSLPGMATAIEAVESDDLIADGAIYDLSGRKVSKAVKGVYIQNGKKVLVK